MGAGAWNGQHAEHAASRPTAAPRASAPLVTVVIPVLNEAARLAGCLDAVADQDLTAEQVEVLVVDGGSTDGTVDEARRLLAGRGWTRAEVVHSPDGDRPSNLNCGLRSASAEILVRVDARSRIPPHYLRRCVELLERDPAVAVVGGRQRAVAAGAGPVEAGVARALNNRWGMGFGRYRRASVSGPADTVYLGAYRTSALVAAGGWHRDLPVNEDFDVNRRVARFGTVWFDPELVVDYVPRSTLGALLRQYWDFGVGKARYWRKSGDRPRPRQVVLLAGPVVAVACAGVLWAGLGISPLWPLGAMVLLGTGIEFAGSDGPRGGLRTHAAALAAMTCIAGGWLAGVACGAVAGAGNDVGARWRSRPPRDQAEVGPHLG